MDKERLKELREEVCELLRCPMSVWNGTGYEYVNELTESGRDLLALIDAEMARQSVTDNAVQRAAMELREFIEDAGKYGVSSYNANYMVDCLEQAALRQYQKTTAIQWKGNNLREVIDLIGWNESASSKWTWAEYEQVVAEKGLKIFTPDGSVMAEIGDWIIHNGKDCYVTALRQMRTEPCYNLAAENERLKAKLDDLRNLATEETYGTTNMSWPKAMQAVLAIIGKDGDDK